MFNKGDILKVNRGLYYHFGVYAGNGRVIHFSAPKGDEINPLTANICEVSLDDFANGDSPEVDNSYEPAFGPEEIVERARKMIDTQLGRYDLLTNNCEHFANWCKTGYTKCQQTGIVDEVRQKIFKEIQSNPIFKEIQSNPMFEEEVTHELGGQKCYDDILAGKGQRRGVDGKLMDIILKSL